MQEMTADKRFGFGFDEPIENYMSSMDDCTAAALNFNENMLSSERE